MKLARDWQAPYRAVLHLSSFIWSQQVESLNGKKPKMAAVKAIPASFRPVMQRCAYALQHPLR
jgi:hypothetical protein